MAPHSRSVLSHRPRVFRQFVFAALSRSEGGGRCLREGVPPAPPARVLASGGSAERPGQPSLAE
eukprot:1806440-Alexandrium_andersonii.AAC.1